MYLLSLQNKGFEPVGGSYFSAGQSTGTSTDYNNIKGHIVKMYLAKKIILNGT